ncbi:MAG: hypothetical protein EOL87_18980 [Spartobacteria bacterium]|nr:hypothetical protein [Spartobacteria bacterium]
MSSFFESLSEDRKGFFAMVIAERSAQDAKWGYPQLNTLAEWGSFLGEESGEAVKELNNIFFGTGNKEKLIEELIQTAAMCLSIIEHYDIACAVVIERSVAAPVNPNMFDELPY